MATKAVSIQGADWWRSEREPASRKDHPAVTVAVPPTPPEALKELRRVLTVKQVADFLQYSVYQVYEWCKEFDKSEGRRGLRSQKINGRIRIFKDDLVRFLQIQATVGRG